MNAKSQPTCYACDELAITKEHAPPRSFFPPVHRSKLITVPSCARHNNDNSQDIEYARNVISTYYGVNSAGQGLFLDKAMRSFDHSPALLKTTFSDIRPVTIQGATCGAFTVDVERIETVMRACVSALHFHLKGEKRFDWEIVLASLQHGSVPSDALDAWSGLLSIFQQIPFTVKPTNAPDVFELATGDIQGGLVYGLRFYKSFLVYAFAAEEHGCSNSFPLR